MDTTESELLVLIWIEIRIIGFYFSCFPVSPSAEFVLLIKEQITGCFPFADQKCCQCLTLEMPVIEFFQVDIGKDIYVVNEERFISVKKRGSMFDASACIQQVFAFIGNMDIDSEVILFLQEILIGCQNHL